MHIYTICCPCGKSRRVKNEQPFVPSLRIGIPGWNYVRIEKGSQPKDNRLEGVCDECRDMMEDDE